MNTALFGCPTWRLMDRVAYLGDRSKKNHQEALVVLAALTQLLPCEPCRRFFLMSWCVNPPSEDSILSEWTYAIHCIVSSKVKVTKNRLLEPSECIVPSLTKEEYDLRLRFFGRGSDISKWMILELLLMISYRVKLSKKKERIWAWNEMVSSLGNLLKNDIYLKGLGELLTKRQQSLSPFSQALSLYRKAHEDEKIRHPSPATVIKKLKEGCTPLKKLIYEL